MNGIIPIIYDITEPLSFEPNDRYGCIYKYSLDTGLEYIGQTKNVLKKRHREHTNTTDSLCIVDRFLKTHGFKLTILWTGPVEDLDEAESYFINQYGTLYPKGYNFTTGGKMFKMSDDVKLRISKTHKELNHDYHGEKNPMWGKTHSLHTRYLLSKQKFGKPRSIESRIKQSNSIMGCKNHNAKSVIQLDLEDNEITRFGSIADAARATGVPRRGINFCVKNKRRTSGGYKWKYAEKTEEGL